MLAQPRDGPRSPGSTKKTEFSTMSWIPVLLALFTHWAGENTPELTTPGPIPCPPLPRCSGASLSPGCVSQPMLNQPPFVSSPLGTTIRLACTLSRDYDVRIYNIYWYQQRPGHPPRFLLRYFSHSDHSQGFKIPPRFSGSKDVAKNTGYLSISGLQPEDEAMYYCSLGFQVLDKEREMRGERREEKEPAVLGSPAPPDTLTLN